MCLFPAWIVWKLISLIVSSSRSTCLPPHIISFIVVLLLCQRLLLLLFVFFWLSELLPANICLPSLLSIPDTYNFSLIYANDPHQFQRRARFFQYQQLCLPKIYAIPAGPFPSTFLNQGATCNQFGSVKPSLCYPTACCGYEQYPVKQDVPIGCVFTGVCCFVGVQVQKPVLVTGVRWGVPMQWR